MTASNIITNDHTVVCPDHYIQLRQGCNWRKLATTYEPCEICQESKPCPGPAFCQEIPCDYCSRL